MRLLILVFLGLALVSKSICRGYYYSSYAQSQLESINYLITEEIRAHQLNTALVPNSPYNLVAFVLEQLNKRINSIGGSCRILEEEIITKSRHYGIEKEGLVENLIRFRELLKFLDDRNLHQQSIIEREKDKQDICEDEKMDLKNQFRNANESNHVLERRVTDLTKQIKILNDEKRRLQAKVNKNSPAIESKTGAISGTNTTETIIMPEKIQTSSSAPVTPTSDVNSLDTQINSTESNAHQDKGSQTSSNGQDQVNEGHAQVNEGQDQVNEGQDQVNQVKTSEPTRRTSPRLAKSKTEN